MADAHTPPLRLLAVPTAVAGAVTSAALMLAKGSGAGFAATCGSLVVVAFFCATHVVLGRVLVRNPELAMASALALYLFKMIVLLLLIGVVRHASVFDSRSFGFAVLACTLVWTVAEVVVHSRRRVLYVTPSPSSASPAPESTSEQ